MADIFKNLIKTGILEIIILRRKYLNRLRRSLRKYDYNLNRRPGKFTEREIEYAFLFNHLHLSPGYRLLEVGAGRSGLALVLAHSGYKVTTIDPEPEHPWVTKGDATKLDFKDNSFDIVTCISTIEHIPNSDKAIEEMLRVVVPGGIIILSFPYNPNKYIKDLKIGGRSWICSVFNNKKLYSWFDKKTEIVAAEYWKQWGGALFGEGGKNLRASRVSKKQAQGICLAVRKLFMR